MYCTQWVGMRLDCLPNNMQCKQVRTLQLQLKKIAIPSDDKLRRLDLAMIGIEKLIQLTLIIINGHNGYLLNYIILGLTLMLRKDDLFRNFLFLRILQHKESRVLQNI